MSSCLFTRNFTAVIELYTLFSTKSLNIRKMVLSVLLLSWLVARGGPCALLSIRFADPSDAVTADTAAVQRLRDCVVLCWNSPRFGLRSGTPIAVERPCCTLSGCWIFHPTSHFSGFKGSLGFGRFTSRISHVR